VSSLFGFVVSLIPGSGIPYERGKIPLVYTFPLGCNDVDLSVTQILCIQTAGLILLYLVCVYRSFCGGSNLGGHWCGLY
jgi:hypothetical protein